MGASHHSPLLMDLIAAPGDPRFDSVLTALGSSQLSMLNNRATGMGTNLDPFTQVSVGYGPLLNEYQLRSLYRSSWFIRRVVEVPPDDMTKAGVELTLHDSTNSKTSTAALQIYRDGGQNVNPYSRRMSCGESFRKAMTWGRLFGQAYAVMRVNGGEDPAKPLTKVKSFEGLSVLDRYALRPVIGTHNPEHPEFYQVARRDNTGGTEQTYNLGQRIHESRVLVFRGAAIHPYDIQLEGDGAYDSIIQQIYEVFTRHYMAKDAISKGLDSYSLFKVAIAGLANLLGADGGTDKLTAYLNSVAQQMSLHRIVVQDTEASKSEFQERTFAGVEGLFQQMSEELTAAANLPHYKIWGSVGKAGLSDSGGAESRAWAEQVQAMQFREFGDNHRRLFHAIFETLGKVPKSWEVEYPSIYTPTPEEEGAQAKTQAETLTFLVRDRLITTSQGYQSLATGQPLENVLEPLADNDVLTIVDEAEAAGPTAEEELAALMGGGHRGEISPGVDDEPVAEPAARDDAADTYTPPKSAQGNAQKVLDWRKEHGDKVKGMTEVGWGRARQLASGEPISLDTVKRIAQFNRHRGNYEKARARQKAEGGNPWEYAGIVAFLGWGGSTAVDWAIGISGRADTATYTKGDPVTWQWGEGTATGRVSAVYPRRVQRTIEGAKIVRRGTPDNPALLIEQKDGAKVLKLASEVSRGRADVIASRADDSTPTKRIIKWNGLEIGLQYFPFDKRHGRTLIAGYGHIRGTKSPDDGMAIDVYVGTKLESDKVYCIEQIINGEFDEEKYVIGVESDAEARLIYESAMPPEFLGSIREKTIQDLTRYKKADTLPKPQPL